MKLGLFLMPLHRPERLHADTYQEDLELMSFADELGYTETWVGEHFTLPWENMPSPELFIAGALRVTQQMKFGTGVSLLHYHDPVHVAHRIAMLDHLAKGRLYFGIGSAGSPSDNEMFGIDIEGGSLRDRMNESIQVILKIWEGKPFHYDGKYFGTTLPEPRPDSKLGFHMKPYQQPHPPIAVGGTSARSKTLEMVGEMGWIPLSSRTLHRSLLPTHWEVVEKGASRSGREASRADWRISREIHVAEDGKKAREEALSGPMGRFLVDYWIPLLRSTPTGLASLKYDPDLPDEAIAPEYMLEHIWIVGDPDECTRQIRDLYDEVGGFGTLLPLCNDWEGDRHKWLRSLELLANEVLPALPELP